jgi:hypothetical protein
LKEPVLGVRNLNALDVEGRVPQWGATRVIVPSTITFRAQKPAVLHSQRISKFTARTIVHQRRASYRKRVLNS